MGKQIKSAVGSFTLTQSTDLQKQSKARLKTPTRPARSERKRGRRRKKKGEIIFVKRRHHAFESLYRKILL